MSFLVAMTGALSPGPLLSYTIIQSASSPTGYLMGFWVILGHSLLEAMIIIVLLFGFSFFLAQPSVVMGIGFVGGVILIWFGSMMLRDIYKGNVAMEFLNTPTNGKPNRKRLSNPVLGGFVVSMANPYWWVWWATIGMAFMTQFNISLLRWPNLLAFFLGHEAGDLAWYLVVSTLTFFGLRRLNRKVYIGVLIFCGLFMIFFGLYLGISPFFKMLKS